MKRYFRELFYSPKHEKVRERGPMTRVGMMAFFMAICLAAMSFMTYAYFSYNISSGPNVIHAARFKVTVSVTEPDNTAIELRSVDQNKYQATLQAGVTYAVTLKPGGTAGTGFCVITADGCEKSYHTQQLGSGRTAEDTVTEAMTFSLSLSAASDVTFAPHWGTSSHYDAYSSGKNDERYITHGETVVLSIVNDTESTDTLAEEENTPSAETTESASAEIVYTIQAGDTLSGIAKQYATTVERIIAYNDLKNADTIIVGRKIKIPPADWVLPADTSEQNTPVTQPTETTTPAETEAPAPETTASPVPTEPAQTTAPAETETSAPETTASPVPTEPTETTAPAETETSAPETTASPVPTEPAQTTAPTETEILTPETTGAEAAESEIAPDETQPEESTSCQ